MKKTGLKRETIDKFYTIKKTVIICIECVKQYSNIKKNDLIIEPSAGNGSFIPYIKKLTNNYKFYDIQPEHNEIIEQDFLTLDLTYAKDAKNVHFVGNPPFGRQSKKAIIFIKKCCSVANTINFILPRSFKKDSMKKYFPLNFHLIKEINLPKNSFTVENKIYDVPCIFQIWKKKKTNRKVPLKLFPIRFTFVKKTETPDISFRRVGVYAGNVDRNINKSEQSHYFIKFDSSVDQNKIIEKMKKIKYPKDNTTGPRSISKQELIKELNQLILMTQNID